MFVDVKGIREIAGGSNRPNAILIHAAERAIRARLEALVVPGVRSIQIFEFNPAVPTRAKPELQSVRIVAARRKAFCRLVLDVAVPYESREWPAFAKALYASYGRIVGDVLTVLESKKGVDLGAAKRALSKDLARARREATKEVAAWAKANKKTASTMTPKKSASRKRR